MPLLPSEYNPPLFFKSGHLSTIYSGLFRKVPPLAYRRERLELPDGDFMDLDWSYADIPSRGAVILLHGLEGDAQRPYMAGSARLFNAAGYDSCSVNFRSCSGETNRLFRSYHSGATEDLHAVVSNIASEKHYQAIYINGFSLGGNMCLKYLGEGRQLPKQLKGAVAVSVPCDLHSSLIRLLSPENILYAIRFKRHLVGKLRLKQELFPGRISDEDIDNINNLRDFDDIYTSRAHGFANALDYYQKCSSRQFLPGITIPTLILNAQNDSFLGPECYPVEEAHKNSYLYLEMPRYGGHVGFYAMENKYYNEKRAIKFMEGAC